MGGVGERGCTSAGIAVAHSADARHACRASYICWGLEWEESYFV